MYIEINNEDQIQEDKEMQLVLGTEPKDFTLSDKNTETHYRNGLGEQIAYTDKELKDRASMVRYWEIVQADGSVLKIRRGEEVLPDPIVELNKKVYAQAKADGLYSFQTKQDD